MGAGLAAGQRSTLGRGRVTFTHFTTVSVSLITRQTLQRAERGQNRTRLIWKTPIIFIYNRTHKTFVNVQRQMFRGFRETCVMGSVLHIHTSDIVSLCLFVSRAADIFSNAHSRLFRSVVMGLCYSLVTHWHRRQPLPSCWKPWGQSWADREQFTSGPQIRGLTVSYEGSRRTHNNDETAISIYNEQHITGHSSKIMWISFNARLIQHSNTLFNKIIYSNKSRSHFSIGDNSCY